MDCGATNGHAFTQPGSESKAFAITLHAMATRPDFKAKQ